MQRYRLEVYQQDALQYFKEVTLTYNEAYARARRIIRERNETVSVKICDAVTNEIIIHVQP